MTLMEVQRSFVAGEDLSSSQNCAVYIDGSDSEEVKVYASPNGRTFIGILLNAPTSGQIASVQIDGICLAKLGGAVELGDYLMPTTGGKLVKLTPGYNPIARYLPLLSNGASGAVTDGASNDLRPVQILPGLNSSQAGVLVGSGAIDLADMADGATATGTVTVTGAATGDAAFCTRPATLNAGIVVDAYVSAADTVTVTATNASGGAVNPGELTFIVGVVKTFTFPA